MNSQALVDFADTALSLAVESIINNALEETKITPSAAGYFREQCLKHGNLKQVAAYLKNAPCFLPSLNVLVQQDITPSLELYNQVRAGFITQGSTFTHWCRDYGINSTNVKAALVGTWDGKKGRKVRADAVKAAGLE